MVEVSDLLAMAMGRQVHKRPRRPRVGHAPQVVVFNVCRHCNMRCPHCYASAGLRPASDDLTTDQAMTVLDRLAEAGVPMVIFSGGEPLLREDIFDLIHHATQRGMAPMLSTNGVGIDDAVALQLKQLGVRYCGISIDGLPNFNDPYRGMDLAFDRALAGVKASSAAGIRTGVRMTISRRNADQLRGVAEHARQAGAVRFYISHLVYAGRGKRFLQDDLLPTETRDLLDDVFAWALDSLDQPNALGIVTGSNDSVGPALVDWTAQNLGESQAQTVFHALLKRGGNSAGQGMLCVDAKGNVLPDQFWRDATLGNLVTQPLAEILDHPLLVSLRSRHERLLGRCADCVYKAICGGSHRERALAADQGLWGPDPACVMGDHELVQLPVTLERKTA